jgi:hypothetical protein
MAHKRHAAKLVFSLPLAQIHGQRRNVLILKDAYRVVTPMTNATAAQAVQVVVVLNKH